MNIRAGAALALTAVATLATTVPAEAGSAAPGPRLPTWAYLAGHTYGAVAWYVDGSARASSSAGPC